MADVKYRWLLSLAAVTAQHDLPQEAVEMKLAAYVDLLDDYPEGCFTRGSLVSAAESFKWFPTFAELAEHLRPIRRDIYERSRKLPAPEKVHVITDEERQRRLSKLEGMTSRLRRMP